MVLLLRKLCKLHLFFEERIQQCQVAYIDPTASTPVFKGVLFVCLVAKYAVVPLGVGVVSMQNTPACVACAIVVRSLALLGFKCCPTRKD